MQEEIRLFANKVRDYSIGPLNRLMRGWIEREPGKMERFEIRGDIVKDIHKCINGIGQRKGQEPTSHGNID